MTLYSFISNASANEQSTTTVTPSSGEATASQSAPMEQSIMANLVPLVAVMAIIYFLLIRPQHKKARELQMMTGGLAKGDHVVTLGGIAGTVIDSSEDTFITLEIAKDVTIQIKREGIGEVIRDKVEKAHTKPAAVKKALSTQKNAKTSAKKGNNPKSQNK